MVRASIGGGAYNTGRSNVRSQMKITNVTNAFRYMYLLPMFRLRGKTLEFLSNS